MKTILSFCVISTLLILLSCRGASSKRTQVQGNDIVSNTEIQTATVTYDTINFKTMKSQEKYTVIKKFDIEGFMKKGGGDIDFTDRDGILVRQWSGEDELEGTYYIDERHYPNSPYLYYCEYDKYGRIKISLTNFYSTFIGKITYYDTSGNIVNETDEDAPYKFSIDDLILKMRREYNIDIEDKKKIWGVYRYVVDNGVFYDVRVRAPYSKNIVYLINGDNGKTLYITETETEWYPGRSEETVYEEYKRVKKIK